MKNFSVDIHDNAIAMKRNIIALYGRDSFEAGYFSYAFAKRPLEYLAKVYDDLIQAPHQ